MKFNITYLSLKTDKHISATPSKVRGYIGNEFSEFSVLHNHIKEDKFVFSYPLVQYKIIDNTVLIVGIDEGSEILKKIAPELKMLSLDKKYEIKEKIIHEKECDIKQSNDEKHYKFISPWLGLNQKNYQRYINLRNWKEKKVLLNNILIGNILSMSKGLGIVVNKRLYAKTRFDDEIAEYKGVKMNAFTGEFKVHYDIPDYFGLGKGVSQGFGCVKQIFDEE